MSLVSQTALLTLLNKTGSHHFSYQLFTDILIVAWWLFERTEGGVSFSGVIYSKFKSSNYHLTLNTNWFRQSNSVLGSFHFQVWTWDNRWRFSTLILVVGFKCLESESQLVSPFLPEISKFIIWKVVYNKKKLMVQYWF